MSEKNESVSSKMNSVIGIIIIFLLSNNSVYFDNIVFSLVYFLMLVQKLIEAVNFRYTCGVFKKHFHLTISTHLQLYPASYAAIAQWSFQCFSRIQHTL
jgi:hypothetical protein